MTDPNKLVTWEGEKCLEPSPCGGSRYVVDCPELDGSPHDQFCRWAG